MAEFIRRHDWASGPLGPPADWPQSLRTVVRVLLDSRYAMWMGWGPDLVFLYNDAYARDTLGKKHPWALGRPAREVWAEIWQDLQPRIDRVLGTGQATWDQGLLLFLERSGFPEETYHTFSYSPLYDDAGRMGGMLCVVTEETDRVISERRVALLRDLAAALNVIKTEADVFAALERCLAADGRDLPFTLTWLFRGTEQKERPPDPADLVSSTGVPRPHPLCGDAGHWPLGRVRAENAPVVVEGLAERCADRPAGPWPKAPERALLVPIAQQGQSQPAGVFVAGLNPHRPLDEGYRGFIDLFVGQIAAALANARAYEEERRQAEALAELDRAKTLFFSNVSHEFRTPLTLMLGPLQDTLAEGHGPLPPRAAEELAVVHRNALRLLKLVNTLLDFSRIEAGRVQATYEPTDLAAFTAELASVFRSAVERAGLRLAIDCPRLPEPVYVDRGMWEKVVLNLLSNAFKFTLSGEIRVSLAAAAGRAELKVADTGCGIPESELPRLFERFHRVEGTRGRTHEGTGIGLALVHELVKLHGGGIAVESRVDQGTTFTVGIPLGSSHLPPDRVNAASTLASTSLGPDAFIEEARRWLPEAAGEGEGDESILASDDGPEARDVAGSDGGQPPRARVILADDNADMRRYLRRLLAGRYEVEACADGAAALDSARRKRPDLVLSDVMMPNLDGFGLLRALRAGPDTAKVPVILLSARAGEEATLDGLQAGADDYLVKPFSARELLGRVEALLERTRAEREREQLLERERQARSEAERASRLKDEFLATLSHELRTPLNAILGWAHLLGQGAADAETVAEGLAVIARNARAQTQLIEDLLDMSRITSGKLRLEVQRVDLSDVIGAAIESVRHAAEAREIRLVRVLDSVRPVVSGDPHRLQQVVWNLLSNAIKFTPRGGRVQVVLERVNSHVELSVADTGQGVPPSFLPFVFDRFRQADGSTRRASGGLGLGLAIVKQLVELHGGTVRADSPGEGLGATFVVSLPLAVTHSGDAPGPAEARPADEPALAPVSLAGVKVLVVDDEPDARTLVQRVLQASGADVLTAASVAEAVPLFRAERPQVIVSDIGMPDQDGYEFLRMIRALPPEEGGRTPAAALTAYARPQDRRAALIAGYQSHVVKPADPAELVTVVASLAGKFGPSAGRPDEQSDGQSDGQPDARPAEVRGVP